MFRQSCLTCSRYSLGNGNMLGGSRHSVYRMLTFEASYAVLGRLVARDMSIVGCHLEHCSLRYEYFWVPSWPCSSRSEYFLLPCWRCISRYDSFRRRDGLVESDMTMLGCHVCPVVRDLTFYGCHVSRVARGSSISRCHVMCPVLFCSVSRPSPSSGQG